MLKLNYHFTFTRPDDEHRLIWKGCPLNKVGALIILCTFAKAIGLIFRNRPQMVGPSKIAQR